MWLFSLSTVQLRKQLMVWSSYFWLGALMTRVTGLSSAPESMAHITSRPGSEESVSQLRSHLRRACPQILSILDSATHLKQSLVWLGGGGDVCPPLQHQPHLWVRSSTPTMLIGILLWSDFWWKDRRSLSVFDEKDVLDTLDHPSKSYCIWLLSYYCYLYITPIWLNVTFDSCIIYSWNDK